VKHVELSVPLSELLPDRFFRENTPYSSFKDFLVAGGFHAETRANIEAIPQSAIDAHVAATTKFDTWHDLLQEALQQYLIG